MINVNDNEWYVNPSCVLIFNNVLFVINIVLHTNLSKNYPMLIKDQNIVNANEGYLEKWISKLKLNFQKWLILPIYLINCFLI